MVILLGLPVVFSAVLFGILPTIQKSLLLSGFEVYGVLFINSWLISGASFLRAKVTKTSLKISKDQFLSCLLTGFMGMFITTVLLSNSYKYIPVGLSTMLNYLYPTFVSIIMFAIFKQELKWLQKLAIISSLCGMRCLLSLSGTIAPKGIILASASALTYGLYFILNEKSKARELPFYARHFYTGLICPIAFSIIAPATHSVKLPENFTQIFLIICMFLCSFFATSFLMKGIEKIGAVDASFISLIEPVVSLFCGVIFLHEAISFKIIVGCILIFFSIVLTSLADIIG